MNGTFSTFFQRKQSVFLELAGGSGSGMWDLIAVSVPEEKNCDMDLNEYGREWHLWYETIETTSPFVYFNDKDIY